MKLLEENKRYYLNDRQIFLKYAPKLITLRKEIGKLNQIKSKLKLE